MNYPRYPEYKQSGVEWLGEVPAHWEVAPLKSRLIRHDGGVWGQDFDDEGTIVLRSTEQTVRGGWQIEQPARRRLTATEIAGALLADGDLVVTKSSGSSLHIGKTSLVTPEIAEMQCCFSNFMQRLRVRREASSHFVWYVLNSMLGRAQLDYQSNTTTGLANLSRGIIGALQLVWPAIKEQEAVVAFLDRETTRIDALMAKKQRLIELLAEKRTALISQAVTKGLNPSVPMKDSGVEWLGRIPAHWEVRRLSKVVSKLTNGFVGPTRDILVDCGVRYLQSLHIKDGTIDFSRGEYYVTEEWSHDHAKSILRIGDVLIVQTGDIGQTALVTEEFDGCNCHALIISRPHKGICTGAFLDLVFRSRYGRQVFDALQTGALHPHLNCTIIRDMFIPLAPIDEQNAITKWITTEIARLTAMRTAVESAVDRLQEYRAALIVDAVTGKIDVRTLG
jgi:type I restriction enzyme S subunit